jgi:synaptobrevin family protein YKT6
MKITSVALIRYDEGLPEPLVLANAHDVSEFSFFQKSGVKEMLVFVSRTLLKRTRPGSRQTVENEGYLCHCHMRVEGIGGIVVADDDYPSRVAFAMINKMLDRFCAEFGDRWKGADRDYQFPFPSLETSLVEYQDPAEVDKILKLHADLEETKEIVHTTIERVLERGVKLDTLVQKSADLSVQSKMFYKEAKKTNKCCVLL